MHVGGRAHEILQSMLMMDGEPHGGFYGQPGWLTDKERTVRASTVRKTSLKRGSRTRGVPHACTLARASVDVRGVGVRPASGFDY